MLNLFHIVEEPHNLSKSKNSVRSACQMAKSQQTFTPDELIASVNSTINNTEHQKALIKWKIKH